MIEKWRLMEVLREASSTPKDHCLDSSCSSSTKPSISVGALLGKSRVGCGMSPETVKQLCMTKARKLKEKYQDTGDWRI